jgi:hypothetical protein
MLPLTPLEFDRRQDRRQTFRKSGRDFDAFADTIPRHSKSHGAGVGHAAADIEVESL